MKKFVRIQSDVTIQVTSGLQHQDLTNPSANIPDRLKVQPEWSKCIVLIEKGAHLYPSEIAEWNTVKALARDKILTIGEFVDDADEKVEQVKKHVIAAQAAIRETKKAKLADIAGE